MCESYGRSLLRVSVAQICQALGWDAVQLTACDLLADVLQRYIQQMGRVCHRYSELYGRTDPVLDDVSQAFRLLGVSLSELDDYVNNLEPVAFPQQLPTFPVAKNNVLQFPQPGAQFAEERRDYIPDYMPPLVSLQEEEEEEVLPDTGTSAEAMQVAMEEDEDDEDEAVNDENHPLKRPLDSPDEALGMMPTSKRPRGLSGLSPEWAAEPREPLTSLNPQRVPPPGMLPSHDDLEPPSPESPAGAPPSFRPQPPVGKYPDPKALGGGAAAAARKPKVSSPGRQRTKSPKGLVPASGSGALVHSPPKTSKERKKSPGRTKSPKSPKSPKVLVVAKAPQPLSGRVDGVHKPPPPPLSGKENIHLRHDGKEPDRGPLLKAEPGNGAIEDSISAVIAKACSERQPDPFAFSSGSDSDSNGFSSPRRLTIMEPVAPKAPPGATGLSATGLSAPGATGLSAPLHLQPGPGKWTLDDSIDEVIRKAHRGGPPAQTPERREDVSSGSASPPTPEPLLKAFQEKSKLAADVKKKLKKELKSKLKKKEKPKDKEREKDKSKGKDKMKEKNKSKDPSKDGKMLWKDGELPGQRDFALAADGAVKLKSRDGDGKKDRDKHKDKKKDKGKKDKEKKDKGKDKSKEERQKQGGAPAELAGLFGQRPLAPPAPSVPVLLQDAKSKDKKKDKKEKKKKKEKERERLKEKERDKEEKRKDKDKRDKERDKERLRLEKVKAADSTPLPPPPPVPVLPSPVIPRLTLRVGGQDKIVISKVLPNSEAKSPAPKTPASKSTPVGRPRSPPPPILLPACTGAGSPPPPPAPAPSLLSAAMPLSSPASLKMPVRSVVTETVSTYVIRDESGNQIWICPGCDKPDDGSPMIGCDDCDDWYHWVCVGIVAAPPADQQWFCVKCSCKKKDKKHKKKKHKPH
ncbi:transcription initiation factor TFIID subunit 3 [Syngnathus scovelli]|uniref:transcription initiation factor TFIID subunit 3 n=1 Tax=Syngnathus scovelli TaxID=161590 RepID=UPI00210F72B3|nr:transcription initiation factor TFIID subunit 3 [Syngnathus scovelli]